MMEDDLAEDYKKVLHSLEVLFNNFHLGKKPSPFAMKYLIDRGFTEEFVIKSKIVFFQELMLLPFAVEGGYNLEEDRLSLKKMYNRILIPYINQDNQVVSYIGRTISSDQFLKYRNPNRLEYMVSCTFGINSLNGLEANSHVVLSEGILDGMTLHLLDIPSVSSVGANMQILHREEVVQTLTKKGIKIIVLWLDYDSKSKTGQRSTHLLAGYFMENGITVKVVSPSPNTPEKVDINGLYSEPERYSSYFGFSGQNDGKALINMLINSAKNYKDYFKEQYDAHKGHEESLSFLRKYARNACIQTLTETELKEYGIDGYLHQESSREPLYDLFGFLDSLSASYSIEKSRRMSHDVVQFNYKDLKGSIGIYPDGRLVFYSTLPKDVLEKLQDYEMDVDQVHSYSPVPDGFLFEKDELCKLVHRKDGLLPVEVIKSFRIERYWYSLDDSISIEVSWQRGNKRISGQVPISSFTSGNVRDTYLRKLIDKGCPIGSSNIKDIASFIRSSMELPHLKTPGFFTYRPGWNTKDGKRYFQLDKSVGCSKEIALRSSLSKALKAKGDNREYTKALKEYIAGDYKASIVLFSMFSTLVLDLFPEVANPILEIYGDSSKGKSSLVRFCAAAVGDPDKFVHTLRSTVNAIEKTAAELNGIPVILDDKSHEDSNDGTSQVKTENLIHSFSDGISKGRLDKHSRKEKQIRYRTSVIITGEKPINRDSGTTGKLVRVLNIPWNGFKGDTDGSIASKLNRMSYECYGHIFRKVAETRFMTTNNNLKESYQQKIKVIRDWLGQKDVQQEFIDRISRTLSVIALSGDLFVESLMLSTSEKRSVMDHIKSYIDECVDASSVRRLSDRVVDHVISRLLSLKNRFRDGIHDPDNCIGVIKTDQVLIYKSELAVILGDSFSPDQFVMGMKESGLLIEGSDRPTQRFSKERIVVYSLCQKRLRENGLDLS